jgi:transglutaminase-like putative cysteine protease
MRGIPVVEYFDEDEDFDEEEDEDFDEDEDEDFDEEEDEDFDEDDDDEDEEFLMRDPTPAIRRVLSADPALYAKTTREMFPDGDAGNMHTVARMAATAKAASTTGIVRAVASAIVGQQPNRDHVAALCGLDQFLRSSIRFKADTLGAEVLVNPEALLHEIGMNGSTACDCDDVATLAAAIIRAMGHQPHFVLYRKRPGGTFTHVAYAASVRGSRPIPFDPQEGVKPGTWTAPENLREIVEA